MGSLVDQGFTMESFSLTWQMYENAFDVIPDEEWSRA